MIGQQSSVSVIVPQNIFLQNVGDVHDRPFIIQINDYNTSLVDLTVSYNVFETEITSNTFSFFYNGSLFFTTPSNSLMTVDISSLGIANGADFNIDVIENVTVSSCSGGLQSALTVGLTNCGCQPFQFSMDDIVIPSGGLSIDVINTPVPECPEQLFDVVFEFTNAAGSPPFGSGVRYINNINFPFNLDLIDETQTEILISGIIIPFTSITTNTANLIYRNNLNTNGWTTITINFDNYSVANPLLQPLFYTPNGWQLNEGTNFLVTFQDIRFDCNYLLTDAQSNCLSIFNEPTTDTPPSIIASNMCGSAAYTNWEWSSYQNFLSSICPTQPQALIEADRTDVEPNDIVTFNYCNYQSASPWTFYNHWAGYFQQPRLFDCTNGSNIDIEIIFNNFYVLSGLVTITEPGQAPVSVLPDATAAVGNNTVLTFEDYDVGSCLTFAAQLVTCPNGDFGLNDFTVRYLSKCREECSCEIPVGEATIPVYRHCLGDCDYPIGTDYYSFHFDRLTQGWTDATMTTLEPNGIDHRAYVCDEIELSCGGSSGICAACTSTCGYCLAPQDVYFELHNLGGDAPITAFNIDFATATFTFDQPASYTLNILPADVVLVGTDMYQIHIRNEDMGGGNFLYDTYFVPGVNSHFTLNAIVTVQLSGGMNSVDGFYLNPQIRGQFRMVVNGTDYPSCDSFGDDMNILVTETLSNQAFEPAACPLCDEVYRLQTWIRGGLPNTDEFPNEFRPITIWPQTFTLQNLTGLNYAHAGYQYWMANNSFSSYIPVNANQVGSTLNINGLVSGSNYILANALCQGTQSGVAVTEIFGPNGFLNLDHVNAGNQVLRVVFNQECPLVSSLDAQFPCIANHPCGTILADPAVVNTNPANYVDNINFTLNGPAVINAGTNPVTVTGTMSYDSNIHPSVDGGWIFIEDLSQAPGSVSVLGVTACGNALTQVNGFWQLPVINDNGNCPIVLTLAYECSDGPIYVANDLIIHYGIECGNLPLDPDDVSCIHNQLPISIVPQPAALTINASGPVGPVDACDDILVMATLTNNEEGNVSNPTIYCTVPPGMSLVQNGSTPYCQYGGNPNMPLGSATGFIPPNIYYWELGSIPLVLDNEGNEFPGLIANGQVPFSMNCFFNFEATCDMDGTFEVGFDADGSNQCNDPIANVTASTAIVNVNPIPDNYTFNISYPNVNCLGQLVSININQLAQVYSGSFEMCLQYPNQLTLSGFSTPFTSANNLGNGYTEYCWQLTIVPGMPALTFNMLAQSGFCEPVASIYTLEYTPANCVVTCSDFGITNFNACCVPCSADFTWQCTEGLCYTLTDLTAEGNLCGNESWIVNGVTYLAGDVFNFCFPVPGVYTVCHTECCQSPIGVTTVSQCYDITISNCTLSEDLNCYYVPSPHISDYASETILGPDGKLITIAQASTPGNANNSDLHMLAHNQNLGDEFQKLFGNDGLDKLNEYNTSVCTDGEYYYNLGLADDGQGNGIIIMKTALDGTPVWGTNSPGNLGCIYGYQDNFRDVGYKIIDMTGTSFVLVVGETNRYGNGNNDPFAMKIRKADGSVVDYKVYYTVAPDTQADDRAYDVREVIGDKTIYALAGDSRLTNGDRNAMGALIDENLNMLANFGTTGMSESNEVFYAVEHINGKLYYAGAHQTIDNDWDGCVALVPVDVNNFGPVEFHIYDGIPLNGNDHDDIFSDINRYEKGLVIAGRTDDTKEVTFHDGLIVFLNEDLNLGYPSTPIRTNREFETDAFFDVCVLSDQLIFTGMIDRTGNNDEAYIINTDMNGMNECCTKEYDLEHVSIPWSDDKILSRKPMSISKQLYFNEYDGYPKAKICEECCVPETFEFTSNDQCQVCIQLVGPCEVFNSYIIQWGDGTSGTDLCHTYLGSGTYVVSLYSTCNGVNELIVEQHIDVVCPCDRNCFVTANWNFQLIDGCTYALVSNSSFAPGTTITGIQWTVAGSTYTDDFIIVTLPAGPQEICLVAYGVDEYGIECENSFCQTITCCENPNQECGGNTFFTTSTVTPCIFQFTDLSVPFAGSQIIDWTWDFGDGTISDIQNPLHAFSGSGPYTVTLEVTYELDDKKCSSIYQLTLNPHCEENCDIVIADLGIHVLENCQVEFSPTVSYGGGCTINYFWEFGDGTTSTLANPTHQFTGSGTYDFCLTVWVNCNGQMCSDQSCKEEFVLDCPCVCTGIPQISVQQTGDCSVQLDYLGNLNTCLEILDVKWTMGNGVVLYGPNQTYNYPAAGTYQICVLITANSGIGQCVLMNCVSIDVACSAGFDPGGVKTFAPCCEPTNFLYGVDGCNVCVNPMGGHCTNYNDYFFSWGDGSPNSDGPCHTYASSGNYIITLYDNCSGAAPIVIVSYEVHVDCPCDKMCLVESRWTFTETDPCVFELTNMSTLGTNTTIVSYDWQLNGVSFASTENAVVSITGTQAVCLIVTAINDQGETCVSEYCQNLTCCDSTPPCFIEGADFTWSVGHDCHDVIFNINVVPALDISNYCGSLTIDGVVMVNLTSITIPYTFTTNGTHEVCLDIWCCDDPHTLIHICHDVVVDCCELDAMIFTWTAYDDDCDSGVFDVTVSPAGPASDFCGTWNINGVTIPFNGFTLPYNFLPGGPWVVCLDLRCCNDPTGETFVTYCDTIVTCPCCAPIGFDYNVCASDGDVCVTANWPTPCVNPGTVVYDYGDGSGMTSSTCHNYSSNGTYVVCMYMICHVMQPLLIECDTIEVNCNSFCSVLFNEGDAGRPRNDRGVAIESTPDGGYIVVGTLNERYDLCTPVTTFTTRACANDESDIYVAKYDAQGVLQFDMIFGETSASPTTFYHESGAGVLVRDDGYYILGDVLIFDNGTTTTSYDNDIIVFKLNLDGSFGWRKRVGARLSNTNLRSREYPAAIVDMKIPGDDAILITGTTNRFAASGSPANNNTNYDFLAVKMNPANGAILNRKAYWTGTTATSSNTFTERARDAVRMETATTPIYAIAGEIINITTSERRAFVVRIDQNLNATSSLVFNNPSTNERAWSIEAKDGFFYVGGGMGANDLNTDMFVLKLDPALNAVGQRLYSFGTTSLEFVRDIKAMDDGRLVVLAQNGTMSSAFTTESEGYLMTIDPGDLTALTVRTTGRPGYEERYYAISSNAFITGLWDNNLFNTNLANKERELYISKLDITDYSSCCMELTDISDGNITGYTKAVGSRNPVVETLDHGYVSGDFYLVDLCPAGPPMASPMVDDTDNTFTLEEALMVKVIPNPNDGTFTLTTADQSLISKVTILDIHGKVMYSYVCNDCVSSLRMNQEELTQGVYLIHTETATGSYVNRMIIAK